MRLWGHGLRTRQVRGPLAPGEKPVLVTVDGRRYQCQMCDAIIIVEPRSVLRYRLLQEALDEVRNGATKPAQRRMRFSEYAALLFERKVLKGESGIGADTGELGADVAAPPLPCVR